MSHRNPAGELFICLRPKGVNYFHTPQRGEPQMQGVFFYLPAAALEESPPPSPAISGIITDSFISVVLNSSGGCY